MIESTLLGDAAWALDALSHGDDPGYTGIVAGISALDALLEEPPSSLAPSQLDVMAAAQSLLTLANECDLPLKATDRARAAELARMLRKYAEQF